jgi:hypothetical protein
MLSPGDKHALDVFSHGSAQLRIPKIDGPAGFNHCPPELYSTHMHTDLIPRSANSMTKMRRAFHTFYTSATLQQLLGISVLLGYLRDLESYVAVKTYPNGCLPFCRTVCTAGPVYVSRSTERGAQRDMVTQMARSEHQVGLHLHTRSKLYNCTSNAFLPISCFLLLGV